MLHREFIAIANFQLLSLVGLYIYSVIKIYSFHHHKNHSALQIWEYNKIHLLNYIDSDVQFEKKRTIQYNYPKNATALLAST